MRFAMVLAFVLILAGLATDAPAGDDRPKPAKKDEGRALSETEWIARILDIEKVNSVGVKKKDVLAFEAKRTVVLVRVKIWDVRSTALGTEIDIVDVMPQPEAVAKNRLPRDPILLPREDRDAIRDWRRWDRLTFKVKPSVAPDGSLSYERLVTGAADIARIPDPGIEYPPQPKDLAPLDSFGAWAERYADACRIPDWRAAWQCYSLASSRLFPMSATARDGAVDAGGRAPRAPVSVLFVVTKPTGVAGFGLVDGDGRLATTARAVVEDPQVAEALKAGTRAEIYFRVHGFDRREDMETHRGRFRVDVTFGHVK